ncbi:carbon-nitrogen hydrolase family protein [Colwellia psychrerythraea]|uniref:Nitrilase/cyanide hydratase and apolipoprotein N-acyltransferase n=1 Tax=Colwellia psychrerythraea TaxID=28229 RepID=A0A099KWE3_COLPS|nr:carbon-nitrogen hydrolase family protein [Colwellia psychrerythraea]KGJ93973.1 Nitrilase/cyanide hydratase and apolipoprotein N-acyltransferase [Colwellia psychrerythraea]
MTPFGIAGIQMNLQHGNNVDAIEDKINLLMCLYPWVEMVIVSELAAHGPLDSFAETMPGLTEQRFCAMAKKHNIWLIPGSFFELKNEAIFNTAPVINPQGEVIARHRKLFPFRPFEEGIEAGDEFVVFDVPGAGRFGLCICYDMWFPEVLRTLTTMGAEVILHPVLTGTNDRDIELNLARSSGALFQSYIIDINGLGVGGIGQSCIIDPAGRTVYQAGATDEFLVTELDFDSIRRQREVGLRNLGQPLKSFRDSKINFTVYNKAQRDNNYLESLGPLQKATRHSKTNMATEPAFISNKELASSELENTELENTAIAESVIHQTAEQTVSLSTSSDIAEYNNLAIGPAVVTASLVTAQHLPLELVFEEPDLADTFLVDQSVIEKPTITTSDESIENDAAVNITVNITPATDIDANYNINNSSNKGNSEEKPKGDNLKWLKEASTQIKQYIKS